VHLAYIWIVSHLCAKNYRNWWKFDEVLTKTNLLSFFGTRCTTTPGWLSNHSGLPSSDHSADLPLRYNVVLDFNKDIKASLLYVESTITDYELHIEPA